MNFENKTITIFGLSRSGLESALLLDSLNAGIKIKVTDINNEVSVKNNLKKLNQRVEFELGRHSEGFVKNSDLIVLSPGIRSDLPILLWAAKKGIKIIGEIELGYLLCPAPIIAVTGTNGKTTVTTLISQVLKYTGKNIHLCGNIGKPFCKEIPSIKKQDLVALEVSSFQLETIDKFKPKVAVFLNFSCNHLDRYNNMREYLFAKKRIFKNQDEKDWAVLNYEDKTTRGVSKEIKSQALFFNHKDKKENAKLNSNYLAVLAVAKIFGINKDKCLEVFRKFRGIEHRLELVRTIEGVDFINDSKSTTVDSAVWALSNIYKPFVMIAGGKDKGSDFSLIKGLIKEKVKELIVIGQAKQKIRHALEAATKIKEADSLKKAISLARKDAIKGDCVLLSPMCASFDMFRDFEHRGKVFKNIVKEIR